MKIVIPTNGDNLDSEISKTFGRTQNFLAVDLDTLNFEIVSNAQNMQSSQGAGIQSAQSAVKAGGDTLIALNCGPKAFRVLTESGVRVFTGIDGSVRKNIEEYKNGSLQIMGDANAESHMGL